MRRNMGRDPELPLSTRQVNLVGTEEQPVYTVNIEVAKLSLTLEGMLEDLPPSDLAIPIPNVPSAVLEKVLRFSTMWLQNASVPGPVTNDPRAMVGMQLEGWQAEFFSPANVDKAMLFKLAEAANYLDIQPLKDSVGLTIANAIENMTSAQLREYFGITDSLTPDEEAAVHRENSWVDAVTH